MPFQFPQTLRVQNSTWYLIYDPNSANTLLPSLQDAKVQNVFGQWVKVPNGAGGVTRLFMSVVDLVMPQVNMPTYKKPAQYVRGFSLTTQEVDPYSQPPQSMAIYTKELEPPVNIAQEFINAVLGQSMADQSQVPQSDWTNLLSQTTQEQAVPKVSRVEVEYESDNSAE